MKRALIAAALSAAAILSVPPPPSRAQTRPFTEVWSCAYYCPGWQNFWSPTVYRTANTWEW